MTQKQKALLLMFVSVSSFSIMQLIVKLADNGFPVMEQVFARNFVTLVVAAFMMRKNRCVSLGKARNQPVLMCRSFLGFAGVYGYFYASRNMIAADATLLHRSSPFFVIIFSAIFLKQKIGRLQIFALLVSAVGAFLVIDPQMSSRLFPALMGLMSAVAAGGAYTAINYLKGKEPNSVIVFHFSLFSCVSSLLLGGRDFVFPDARGWLMLAGIGCFAAVGQLALTRAYQMEKPGEVSIINYFGIIFSAIFGYVFLDEVMTQRAVVGMLMIFAAAVSLYCQRNRESAPEKSGIK